MAHAGQLRLRQKETMKAVSIAGILLFGLLGLFTLYSVSMYHDYRHDMLVMQARHPKSYMAWLREPGSLTYRH